MPKTNPSYSITKPPVSPSIYHLYVLHIGHDKHHVDGTGVFRILYLSQISFMQTNKVKTRAVQGSVLLLGLLPHAEQSTEKHV